MTERHHESFERGLEAEPGRGAALVTWVDAGPDRGSTAALHRGFTGLRALAFRHDAGLASSASATIASGLDVAVHRQTQLRYLVFPASDPQDPFLACGVSLDLVLDDGSRVSALGVRDDIGVPLTPEDQSRRNALTPDQWNLVVADLAAAAGRRVVAIELRCATAAGTARGWIDDVSIAPATPVGDSTPADLVDTRRGTNSSRDASRGNTVPATALPNGVNLLVPMTDAGSQKWLYEYAGANDEQNLPRLQGLGISHQPSPWMGDRMQLAIMPAAAGRPVLADPVSRALPFDHALEQARPHEYSVRFVDGLRAEMTPTLHGACYRFHSPEPLAVIVDRVHGDSAFAVDDQGRLTGWVDNGTDLSVGRSRMFVAGRFDRRPVMVTDAADRTSAVIARFADAGVVTLRLATSFLSLEQAEHNLLETEGGYDAVRDAARDAWNEVLGVLEVPDASRSELVAVYSNLYRVNLYPNWYHETGPDGVDRYASPVLPQQPATPLRTGAQIREGRMAVNHGFWDTYRTVWPAYSLLYPERTAALLDGFLQQYRDSGWIARWSSPGHADLMTGTNADAAFADAILKGVPVRDPLEVFDALLKSATVAPPSAAVGRKGNAVAPFLGYVPDDIHESVSWTTENAINDAAIAALADELAAQHGLPASRRRELATAAAYLRHRSGAYRALVDPANGFLRSRGRDGGFTAGAFDPEEWGGPYTETNAWTFAFHAPHDVGGLAELLGGPEPLAQRLDEYFGTPETGLKPGTYGQVIHEMTEARDVRLGQLGFSNQPAHAIPFLYALAGRPWRTQELLRDILTRLYRGSEIGQGYPGDEDNGEMSAWHLFGCLGLYPLQVGAARYLLTAPLFPEARLRLESGATLTVLADGHGADRPYVTGVTFDGAPLDGPWIEHRRIAAGGVLRFAMSDQPGRWGAGATPPPGDAPLVDLTGGASVTLNGAPSAGSLVDDDVSTVVVLTGPRPTVDVGLPAAAVLELYTLSCDDPATAPASWELHGLSADGWIALDVRDREVFAWPRQTRPFTVGGHEPCTAYRMVFTHPAGRIVLAELELLARAD